MATTVPPDALQAPTAIVIRAPNWLGDLLIGTAFIQAVLQRFPGIPVDVIVPRAFQVLPLPHRGRLLPFDRTTDSPGRMGRRLRGQGYSHFFVLPPSLSSAWMAFRSGVPHRIGYRGQLRGWLLRPALAHRFPPRSVHLSREYLGLLGPWMDLDGDDIDGAEPSAHLPLPPGWVEHHLPAALAEIGAQGESYVVLVPGAEYGPARQWPVEHYRETAAALHRAGRRVVVDGLEKHRSMGDAIVAGLDGALNLCGETGVEALVALISRAGLVISNDSGAMHMAAALQRPQIALFGSTNPAWSAPLNSKAHVFTRNEHCSPCYARSCPLGHHRCLRELAPGPVIEKALTLLPP